MNKLDLDRSGRAVQRYARNPNALHGALCAAAHSSGQNSRLLYRVVGDRSRNAVYAYSDTPLDGGRLPAGLTIVGQRDLTDWIGTLNDGAVVMFDLLAVPSKKVLNQNSSNSRRVILRDPEERLDWIRRRLNVDGCEVLELREGEQKRTRIFKGREKRTFHLMGYRYSGLLKISDPQALTSLIETGIGPEKAYGYGMLLVSQP